MESMEKPILGLTTDKDDVSDEGTIVAAMGLLLVGLDEGVRMAMVVVARQSIEEKRDGRTKKPETKKKTPRWTNGLSWSESNGRVSV